MNKTFENKDENMLSRELELMPKGFKKKQEPEKPTKKARLRLCYCWFKNQQATFSNLIT